MDRDTRNFHSTPTPVEIQQVEWEFTKVLERFTRLNPRRVLELGVHEGGTLYHWLRLAKPGARIVGVDLRDFNDEWWQTFPHMKQLWYIQGNTHNVETLTKIQAFAPFDFAHIDADHLEESARSDWRMVCPMMRKGGLVVFHDALIVSPAYGVNVLPVIEEIEAEGYQVERLNAGAPWGTTAIVTI